MNKASIALISLMLLLLAACRAEPTPTTSPATLPPFSNNLLPLAPSSLLSVARNPAGFKGQVLELSGGYKPLPIQVCAEEVSASPATWALTEDGVEILASGFDSALRDLAQPGLNLIVRGEWQEWSGPVGCDRRAPVEQIWYLAVTNIISPNPLTALSGAAITGTPSEMVGPVGTPIAVNLTPVSGEDGLQATIPPLPAATEITGIIPTSTLIGGATATLRPNLTISPDQTLTPTTSTPPPTSTSLATATTSATPTTGALTPSATVTRIPLATATATLVSGETTPIGYDDLMKSTITANAATTWRLAAVAGDVLSISGAPSAGLDISLELKDPSGATISTVNAGSSGGIETIGPMSLSTGGIYQITVRAVGFTSGEYVLVVQTPDSLPFVIFQGNMAYGDTRSGSVVADQDHLFNFQGTSGEVITIVATATTDDDLILYLNGPDSFEIDFADNDLTDGPPNDVEEIRQLTLTQTGMYTIGVGEGDFNPIGYSLVLQRN